MEEELVTEAEDPENPEECVASRLSSIIGLKEPQESVLIGITGITLSLLFNIH